MATARFRTAARLTSKPDTPDERRQRGEFDGRRSAFRGDRYTPRWDRGDDYGEGFSDGYHRVVSA